MNRVVWPVVGMVVLVGACADDDGDAPRPDAAGTDGGMTLRDVGSGDRDTGGTPPPDGGPMPGVDAGPRPSLDGTPQCLSSPAPAVHDDLTSAPGDPPPPAGAEVSFLSDWVVRPDTGGWRYTQIIDPCRMHLDGTTWHGSPALRVEVNPGDDPLNSGGERAEVLIMQDASGNLDEGPARGAIFYATSYYFPPEWDATFLRGDGESWSFVMQLYPLGGIAVGRRTPGGAQEIFFTAGDGPGLFAGTGALALERWIDLVLRIDWSAGHATIWRREEGDIAFTIVLDTPLTVDRSDIYLKQGLYRGPNVSGRTDVLWMGPTARGSTFLAVEVAAFGTSAGP